MVWCERGIFGGVREWFDWGIHTMPGCGSGSNRSGVDGLVLGFRFRVSGSLGDFCVEVTFRFDIRIGHTIDGIKRETKRREREERKRRSHIQL